MTKIPYDIEWDCPVKYTREEACSGYIEETEHVDDTLLYAERLGARFSFVRQDSCDCEGRLISEELPLTPIGCLSKVHNALGNEHFGDLFRTTVEAWSLILEGYQ